MYHIDPRMSGIRAEKVYHQKPVLSLLADDKYIITASEDKTIAVFDRAADKLLKTIRVNTS